MTAARKLPTELENVISQLRRAAQDLSSAADRADDAVSAAEDAFNPEAPHSESDARALAELVVRMHDDEHEGPRMWCDREACRKADGFLT